MRALVALLAFLATAVAAQAERYYDYPANAVPVVVDSANVPTGPISISMPATANWTNYLTALACTGTGATSATIVLMVLGSLPNGSGGLVNLTWQYVVPAGVTTAAPGVAAQFSPPIVSQPGGAIGLAIPSIGAGNTNFSCNMRGYRAPTQP